MNKKTLSSPLTLKELEEVARNLMETARGILLSGQDLHPLLFMLLKGKMIGAPMDTSDKDAMEVLIPALVKKYQPTAAFLVTDSWKKDITNTIRIGEIITIFGICDAGRLICAQDYKRDEDNQIIMGELLVSYNATTRFFDGCFSDPFEKVSPTVH
jgi:hypothetical protein